MGDPKKSRRKYQNPRKPWARERIENEKKILADYGLVNKKEIRKMEAVLRNKRANARKLLALQLEQRVKRERELINSLSKLNMLTKESTLDDVLGLKLESILERRLQTIVYRKALANTIKQARQLITHGHISVLNHRMTSPSYLVTKPEEDHIAYYGNKKIELKPKVKEKVKAAEVKPEGSENTEAQTPEKVKENGEN
ncbi:MAG: 30S ribosomal protein S4 [Candidatus Diapherotrites archaeon CG08_land_8_20_14_0_20_34_12]|nr:MAG: 30S ribosomal protein S4 [Candidatus Diapherotrites archaeon CG08_land_8_20_14_0_20_34_12]